MSAYIGAYRVIHTDVRLPSVSTAEAMPVKLLYVFFPYATFCGSFGSVCGISSVYVSFRVPNTSVSRI